MELDEIIKLIAIFAIMFFGALSKKKKKKTKKQARKTITVRPVQKQQTQATANNTSPKATQTSNNEDLSFDEILNLLQGKPSPKEKTITASHLEDRFAKVQPEEKPKFVVTPKPEPKPITRRFEYKKDTTATKIDEPQPKRKKLQIIRPSSLNKSKTKKKTTKIDLRKAIIYQALLERKV